MNTATKELSQKEMLNYGTTATAPVPNANGLIARYNNFIEGLKFSHFGVMAMAILIGSCLGSIAAMFLFYNGAPIWVFAIGLFASLANLVASIGQAPTKWVVNIFILSVLVNSTLMAIFPLV